MDFETVFGEFLDRREYDQAENALFSIVRIAFTAGWLSAGGQPPRAQKIIEFVHKDIDSLENTMETDIKLP